MRKIFYLLFVAGFINTTAKAAVGDTTIVQAQDTTWLSYYGNYDTSVVFPDGSKTYRKIYMVFTLGKYHCPGSPMYCGDWDYTVLNYLMTKTDTVELSRLITPYANVSYARFPWTLQQHYVYDVTDYYPLLKDTATVRILYSGYSGGFTANIKFLFIEGTPERNVVGIKRLWHGSPGYGTVRGIDSSFLPVSLTAPASAVTAEMKVLITGHGSDANGCCEFASHYYEVMLNSTAVAHTDIWRSDCGSNELYPQSGTWIYERGNWCPGALVRPHFHNLPGITGSSNYLVGLHFEPYSVSSPSGIYTTEAQIFYYGAMNKTLDASIDDIIAPTNYEGYYRENPTSGDPVITIRNTGSTAISSIQFQYGVEGYTLQNYTWNGSLASLTDTTISLPVTPEMAGLSGFTKTYRFIAKIVQVNGSTDNDASNDTMGAYFTTTPIWPFKIAIQLKTNGSKMPDGYSETSWMIYNVNDLTTPVAQRINNNVNTTYNDTVSLFGAYKLVVVDSGCDGINWWNYVNYSPNPGTGSFKVTPATSGFAKPLTGYFGGDFGCGFTQYFTAGWPNAGLSNAEQPVGINLETYPNPVKDNVSVNIIGSAKIDGTLQLFDAMGRVVMTKDCNEVITNWNLQQLTNGMYTIVFVNKAGQKLQTRIIVAK
jgi:hypothetical protein